MGQLESQVPLAVKQNPSLWARRRPSITLPCPLNRLSKTRPCGKASEPHTMKCNLIRFAAYYNAGSAALVLVFVFVIIGLFLWWRKRNNGVKLPSREVDTEEESIPLTRSRRDYDEDDTRRRKGKDRQEEAAVERSSPTIFEVGSDDEEEYQRVGSARQ